MQEIAQLIRRIEQTLRRHPTATLYGILLICTLLVFSRRPDVLLQAQFWAEDGAVWYIDAYSKGLPLFQTYAGTLALIPRIVSWLSLALPFGMAPLFFNAVGLLCLLLPVVLLNSSRFRHILPSRLAAATVSVLYVGTLNITEIFGNLANVQWSLALVAFMVLIARAPLQRKWRIFDGVVLIAACLTGPAVLVLLPIAAIKWYLSRDSQARINFGITGITATIQLACLFIFSHYERVSAQADANFLDLVRMIGGQVFMGGIVGEKYVTYYYDERWVLYMIFFLGLSLIVYAVVYGPLWLKLLNIFWPLLIASMLFSLKVGEGYNMWQGLTNPTGGQRYWYIPIVACVSTILWLTFAAKHTLVRVVGFTLLALLLIIGLPQGWRMAPLKNLNFPHYARQFEQLAPGKRFNFPINPGWQVIIYKK